MNTEKLREYFRMSKQLLTQAGIKVVLYPVESPKGYELSNGVLKLDNTKLDPKRMTDIVAYLLVKVMHKSQQVKEVN
jgi:hypothetical protein